MHGARLAVWTMAMVTAAAAAGPAAALPAGENAKPRIVSAEAAAGAERAVSVVVVGRDRDDVVRGADISWGETEPALGLSACELSSRSRQADRRRRGKRARFEFTHSYAAPGDYTITLRALSGGCGKRTQQSSATRTLTVHVG